MEIAKKDGIGEKAFGISGIAEILLEHYHNAAFESLETEMYSELE